MTLIWRPFDLAIVVQVHHTSYGESQANDPSHMDVVQRLLLDSPAA